MKFWYPPDQWRKSAPLLEGKTYEKLFDEGTTTKVAKKEGKSEKSKKVKKDKKSKEKESKKGKKTDKDAKKKKSAEEVKNIQPEPPLEKDAQIEDIKVEEDFAKVVTREDQEESLNKNNVFVDDSSDSESD